MYVCYSFLDEALTEDLFYRLLSTLPSSIQCKIITYKPIKSRWRALTGKILLKKLLHLYRLDTTLNDLYVEKTGRPYLSNLSRDFDFNISHSGDYVICVMSDRHRVGIDIEKIRGIKLDAFRRHMTSQQWQDIITSKDGLRTFFYHWTIKESVLKADGRGIAGGLVSVETKDSIATLEGKSWFYREISIDDNYICHIASDEPIGEINLIKIDLNNLLT